VTLTLGVDTPYDAWLEIIPPPQIKFEDGDSKNTGIQGLIANLDPSDSQADGRRII